MARQARKISETDYYHVIMRGNNKSYIFENEKHKEYFKSCLELLEEDGEIEIAAWCLMDNHVHLVVKIPHDKLESAFKRLNIKYAMYWHRMNKSVGHVFEGRYKSEPIESDASLINTIRYVHNNPLKAKIVGKVDEYRWSSYYTYLTGIKTDVMKSIWKLFNNNEKNYCQFHEIEDDQEYLDIKEDIENLREQRVKKTIGEVCRKYGINDSREIHQQPEILEEILKKILENNGMSGRTLARFTGVSEATVRRIRKKM